MLLAGFCALIVSSPDRVGLAQQTGATAAAQTGPSGPATLDPDWLKLPSGIGKFEPGPTLQQRDRTSSKIELPDKIKLGDAELHFDTGRNDIADVPPGAVVSADPTGLNSHTWLAEHRTQQPQYFGLSYHAPMQ